MWEHELEMHCSIHGCTSTTHGIHSNAYRLYCQNCPFSCNSLDQLTSHRLEHARHIQFDCDLCIFTCNNFSTLKMHKFSHTLSSGNKHQITHALKECKDVNIEMEDGDFSAKISKSDQTVLPEFIDKKNNPNEARNNQQIPVDFKIQTSQSDVSHEEGLGRKLSLPSPSWDIIVKKEIIEEDVEPVFEMSMTEIKAENVCQKIDNVEAIESYIEKRHFIFDKDVKEEAIVEYTKQEADLNIKFESTAPGAHSVKFENIKNCTVVVENVCKEIYSENDISTIGVSIKNGEVIRPTCTPLGSSSKTMSIKRVKKLKAPHNKRGAQVRKKLWKTRDAGELISKGDALDKALNVKLKFKICQPDKGLFTCKQCDFSTRWGGDMSRHHKAHFKLRCCDQCNFICYTAQELTTHTAAHRTPTLVTRPVIETVRLEKVEDFPVDTRELTVLPECYVCNQCEFVCNTLSHLQIHKVSHDDTPFPCDLCPYTAKSLWLLKKHKFEHIKAKFRRKY